ncbi:MAG TPA: hypothetical protein PKZ69_05860 [Candidatus Cloacimonadota bacterium]|mgnify:FL=1|nr:hypothetical protein [Candidatus Cloacimonadota bacterium]HPK41131.1 hypothetical protein [Candidatus Cloacimonadota bacterium]
MFNQIYLLLRFILILTILILFFSLYRIIIMSKLIKKLKEQSIIINTFIKQNKSKDIIDRLCINPLTKQKKYYTIFKGDGQINHKNYHEKIDYNVANQTIFKLYKVKDKRDK